MPECRSSLPGCLFKAGSQETHHWLLIFQYKDICILKVHLVNTKFFSLKRIYLLFEILLWKNFWIRINPRFSVPRRNLKNNSKTPPFWLHDRVWGEWVQRLLWRLPRKIEYLPSSHCLQVQYIFEKCAKTPFRDAIGCCNNIPDLKKDILYNLTMMIGQWYNKNVNDGWFCRTDRTRELTLWEP